MATNPHYGGTLTRGGRLSTKPREGTQFRTEVMLEKLVRFDLAKAQGALILDEDLARILHRSQRHLNVIRKKASYLAKRMELTTGISVSAGETVELTIARQRQMLREMMPTAMRVIADSLCAKPTSIQEKRIQTNLALEVLDREGTFPKISRTDSHLKIEHDYSSADGISKDLLESMDGSAQHSDLDKSIIDVLEANEAFSNSDTLTSAKQEKAMKILELTPMSNNTVQ
jgi:hypothetical protein